jgi:peptidoglycan hydrolase-like protein with peptidoglycan-binding domain
MGWGADEGANSNNWGAVTAGQSWIGATFEHKDSRPNTDGSNSWYVTRFRAYPTADEGAQDLVRQVYKASGMFGDREKLVLPAATAGDTLLFSTRLYATRYYTGFGASAEQRIAGHHAKVIDACVRIARALSEPMPDGSSAPALPPPTLRQGMREPHDLIVQIQSIVGAAPLDGVFGPNTAKAVAHWQSIHRLKQDSIWGPVCWMTARTAGLII